MNSHRAALPWRKSSQFLSLVQTKDLFQSLMKLQKTWHAMQLALNVILCIQCCWLLMGEKMIGFYKTKMKIQKNEKVVVDHGWALQLVCFRDGKNPLVLCWPWPPITNKFHSSYHDYMLSSNNSHCLEWDLWYWILASNSQVQYNTIRSSSLPSSLLIFVCVRRDVAFVDLQASIFLRTLTKLVCSIEVINEWYSKFLITHIGWNMMYILRYIHY